MVLAASGYAQQNAQYNQYIFNSLIINPAYAGTKDILNVNAIYSSQWSGLKGSPNTQTVSLEGPVTSKIGLGVHLINDNIGAQSQQGLFGSYAYKVSVNDKLKLSLGLALGASYFTLDGTKLTSEELDPAIPTTLQTKLRFDSKTGLFLYSQRFYAGFSVSDLLADVIKSKDLLVAKQIRHYYLTAGYVLDVSEKIKWKPSFLMKEDFKAPTNLDLSSYFLYNERFWIGATVRTGASIFNNEKLDNTLRARDAVIFMMDYNITDNFRLGYAYTLSTTALKDYPGHEIALSYYFAEKGSAKMKTPRYF
jgi:type IX secretion system PorP/SprF family membrane protein